MGKTRLALWVVLAALPITSCGSGPLLPTRVGAGASIRYLGGRPPGGMIPVLLCDEGPLCTDSLQMTFEVIPDTGVARPVLEVTLLDETGRSCAVGFAFNSTPLPARQPTRLVVSSFTIGGEGCPYPGQTSEFTTLLARVRLMTQYADAAYRGVVAEEAFRVDYTLAGPPLSRSPTAPQVTSLCWHITNYPSGGFCGDRPLQGDPTEYECVANDRDGDALTMTITFRSVDGCPTAEHCWSASQTFLPRLVPLPVSVTTSNHGYPETRGAVVTCSVVDSRGLESHDSFCFGDCS